MTTPWWASDDPWALSPAAQAALDEARRLRELEAAETPTTPPF